MHIRPVSLCIKATVPQHANLEQGTSGKNNGNPNQNKRIFIFSGIALVIIIGIVIALSSGGGGANTSNAWIGQEALEIANQYIDGITGAREALHGQEIWTNRNDRGAVLPTRKTDHKNPWRA